MSTMGYLNLGILWAARSERNKTAIVVREANDPEVLRCLARAGNRPLAL